MNRLPTEVIVPGETGGRRGDLHTASGRWQLGLLLTLVAAGLWGVLPVALKLLAESLDAYTISWYRLVVAFAVLFAFLTAKRKLPDLRKLNGKYALLLALTCFGICINYSAYVLGLDIVGPAPAQLLIQLNAVFVILGGIFIFGEHFRGLQFVGLIGIIVGLAMFFHERLFELLTSFTEYSLGVLLLVCSAAALATYSLTQKQLLVRFSSLQISMMVFGAGTLILLPITAAGIPKALDLDLQGAALLLFCAFTTLAAFGSYAEALQHWETTKISAVLSTVPLISLGFAELTLYFSPGLFASDPVTPLSVLGAIVLVIGSYLVVRRKR